MRALLLSACLALSSCAFMPLPPLSQDGAPVAATSRSVPLDPTQPERSILGRLRYLGGVEIESADKRVGGFSSLKRVGGRLYAVTDAGDWAVIDTMEQRGRLVGAKVAALGDLLELGGEALQGTQRWDAEGLVFDGAGWLVAFEHQHRIWNYPALGARPQTTGIDPVALFGPMDANQGVETIAARNNRLFLCAERLSTPARANCVITGPHGTEPVDLSTPEGLDPKTAFPVDADWGRDGNLYILMRSWSGGNDYRAAIYQRRPDGQLRLLAAVVAPLTRDNFEGLALREERGRTFLYLISDDNFGVYDDPAKPQTWQRTLLMKFELLG